MKVAMEKSEAFGGQNEDQVVGLLLLYHRGGGPCESFDNETFKGLTENP
jgi:hypothetical protein